MPRPRPTPIPGSTPGWPASADPTKPPDPPVWFEEVARFPAWARFMIPVLEAPGLLMIIALAASGRMPWSVAGPVLGLMVALAGALSGWIFAARISVRVVGDDLLLRLIPGFGTRRVPLVDIVEARGGRDGSAMSFGVQMRPGMVFYSAGQEGRVIATTRSGLRLTIGTDRPDQLVEALGFAATPPRVLPDRTPA